MEEQKLNITIPENYDGKPIILHVLEGSTPANNDPKGYTVKDNISLSSIMEFVSKKEWENDARFNKGLVIFSIDPESAYIKFLADPNNALAIQMEAKLVTNPDFTDFGINQDKTFTQKDLEKFIKTHAHCFADVEDAKELISKMQNFEARYEQTVIKEDNRQGAKNDVVTSAIKMAKGELPATLKLRMPLYKHQKPVEFEVAVEIDKMPSNLPGFSFYSLDIEILKREQVAELILPQIDALKSFFPCLEA